MARLLTSLSCRTRPRRPPLRTLLAVLCALGWGGGAAAADWVTWRPWTGPCAGDCAAAVYGGWYVEESMTELLLTSPRSVHLWTFEGDQIVAGALSRRVATLWGRVDVEPEAGIARRFGEQDETEVWGAAFFRWRGFPWDGTVVTTVAVSTGFNYASDVSEKEQDRARDDQGDRLMHFFSPEVTFALPSRPDVELMFRFHHRSGVWGLVSDAWGGAQYGTVGVRIRF